MREGHYNGDLLTPLLIVAAAEEGLHLCEIDAADLIGTLG